MKKLFFALSLVGILMSQSLTYANPNQSFKKLSKKRRLPLLGKQQLQRLPLLRNSRKDSSKEALVSWVSF